MTGERQWGRQAGRGGAHLAPSISKNWNCAKNVWPLALNEKITKKKREEKRVLAFMSAEHHLAVVQFPAVICFKYVVEYMKSD